MNEQTRHRLAFDLYVRLGPDRSLDALARALREDVTAVARARPPSRSTLERWSSTYHWRDRLADMEREARVKDAEAQVQALRNMNDRHRKEGLALQQKALERIAALPAGEMSTADAIRGLAEGVRLERLGAGAPTEHVKQEGADDGHPEFRHFSIEELRRLAELGERRAGGSGEEEPK